MARGRKPALTLDEQLEEEQIKMNRLSELDELIEENGLSYDEVKELLGRVQ